MPREKIWAFVRTQALDPDERRENALLYKALRRRLGDSLHGYDRYADVPDTATAVFGRIPGLRAAGATRRAYPTLRHHHLPYWRDPAFLAGARREIRIQNLDEACRTVAEWQARGRAAFVKATRPKLFAARVAPGQPLLAALDSLAYSLCDEPECLIVQEAVTMRDEYRIFVVDGEPVTGCGCIDDRTPANNRAPFDPTVATDRGADQSRDDPILAAAYRRYAANFLKGRSDLTCTLDLAIIDGGISIVEMNPLHLGSVGLYACDVQRLADRVLTGLGLAIPRDADLARPESGVVGTSRPLCA